MSDIVTRLRNWRTVHLARLHLLMEEAADEMERLRADWPEQLKEARSEIERLRLSASGDCPEPENAASEDKVSMRQNMTTLTPVERCVLREVRHGYADVDDVRCTEIAHVIDRLLSRAGSNDANAGERAAKCTVPSKKLPERERVANHPENPDGSTLTNEEREAVQRARDSIAATMPYESVQSASDFRTLGGLLERMGGER